MYIECIEFIVRDVYWMDWIWTLETEQEDYDVGCRSYLQQQGNEWDYLK